MMPLVYFLLGIVFIQYFIPLCDSLLTWAQTAIERKKMKPAKEIVLAEKEMRDIVNPEEEFPKARQIGFVVDDPSEYETDDEDDDEEEEPDDE